MKANEFIVFGRATTIRRTDKNHCTAFEKTTKLLDIKAFSGKLQTNPKLLSGKELTVEQTEILKLGLRYGLGTRPNNL